MISESSKEIFNADFFNKLNSIKLATKLNMDSNMVGGRKSRQKGNSIEFSDFREYNLGDDIRRIDWNAYGRFNKLYLKQYMEEKEGRFNIFLDSSKSMDYGKNKSVYSKWICGALSYLVLNNLDRINISCLDKFNNGINGISGSKAFYRVLDWIANVDFKEDANITDWVHNSNIKGSGTSIIVSDFYLNDLEELLKFLKYKNQEIILIHLLSKEELEVDYLDGTLNLIDSEDDSTVKITMTKSLLKKYKENLNNHQKHIEQLSRKYNAKYVFVSTDISLDRLFFDELRGIYEI